MVRSYLRHGPTQAFGLVCSAGSNAVWDGKLAYVPALEDVLVWDLKKGKALAMWHETGHSAEVTCISRAPHEGVFAVGYTDGSIRLWDSASGTVLTTLNGHKKGITSLAFDEAGVRLASGSQDTDIIIWDVVAEAGLFRLRGHRNQITAIKFLSEPQVLEGPSSSTQSLASTHLLTSSKDTFLKLWDLSTQHCMQTVVAHNADIWSFDVDKQGLIFTGSGEGELKAWRIDFDALKEGLKEDDSGAIKKVIQYVTILPLSTRHRVSQVLFHPSAPYLAVQSHDRNVEIFRIRTEDEIRRKQARRKRRDREKAKAKDGKKSGKMDQASVLQDRDENAEAMDIEGEASIDLTDLFTPYLVVRASGKIRSFDFAPGELGTKGVVPIFTALASNSLEVYSIPPPVHAKSEVPEATRMYSLDMPGHRTDIRSLCLSSDDELLASASHGALKIWNVKTTACIRTLECGHATCSTFLPGDRQVAVGTKSGEILVYDIPSSTLLETIKAHTSTLWSMHVYPDGRGMVTGSADKDVKFWDFERPHERYDAPVKPVHVRTLKMSDEVLSVRCSPNGKLLAVSLLDSTVKVFYQDSLKFFLSLYGHKLPVLSMDISDDSKLLVTCSADKNVKIWGLDFGDCHKSIFAHDESIMQVAFEKKSHYFWSVGKDKMLKYWDGDKFENIQKLEGHHGEVWALAVSNFGNFVMTGSRDKSIRVWEKLDEPLFLEEERERELERLYDNNVADSLNRLDAAIGSGAPDVEGAPGQTLPETGGVSKQTTETLMAGERIIEALDIADEERASLAEYFEARSKLSTEEAEKLQPPARHATLAALGLEPEEHVLKVVEKIPNTALFDALLVLPFGKVQSLLVYLNEWAKRDWNISLVSRIIFFLLKTHHHQIVAQRIMRTSLISLRHHLRKELLKQKEVLGYNLAALRYLQRQEKATKTAQFLDAPYEEDLIEDTRQSLVNGSAKKRKRVVMV